MTASALVVMVAVCSLVWGGFALLLVRAVRQESGKSKRRAEETPAHPSP